MSRNHKKRGRSSTELLAHIYEFAISSGTGNFPAIRSGEDATSPANIIDKTQP